MLSQKQLELFIFRMRTEHTSRYSDICYSHIGKLLSISDKMCMVELLGELPVNRAASTKISVTKESKKSHELLFGASLTNEGIEKILPVIKYLQNSGCEKQLLNSIITSQRMEGLFRKSGSCARQRMLKEKLCRGEDVNMQLAVGTFNAYDCTSVLKKFLSELPEPVLTDRHFHVHCLSTEMAADQKLELLQLVIQFLPFVNVRLLRLLLSLLKQTSEQRETKMTADTLGVIFAPHLILPRKTDISELARLSVSAAAEVSFMIVHSAVLFQLPERVIQDIIHYPSRQQESPAVVLNHCKGVVKPLKVLESQIPLNIHNIHEALPAGSFQGVDPKQLCIDTNAKPVERKPAMKRSKAMKQLPRVNSLPLDIPSQCAIGYSSSTSKNAGISSGDAVEKSCSPQIIIGETLLEFVSPTGNTLYHTTTFLSSRTGTAKYERKKRCVVGRAMNTTMSCARQQF